MIFAKHHNLTVFFLIAVFGLASIHTCVHGHCGNETALNGYQQSHATAEPVVKDHSGGCDAAHDNHGEHETHDNHDQSDNHNNHSGSHLCACSCHAPASVGSLLTPFFTNRTESIYANHFEILAKGFINRIDRPPRLV